MQQLQTDIIQPIELSPLVDEPLVSVLVPNYNYAKYIGETLDSVICQTYPYFEVIVCDDGSQDNSCEVIESYTQRDARIKLVRKQNGGVATALNAAYRKSKGEIICILDADDVWMNNKLQKVLELFRSDPKCGFAIHNVMQIDGQGNFIKSTPMLKNLASGWVAPYALDNGGSTQNIPPASALSIRREVAEYVFPMNEAFRTNADSLISWIAPLITVVVSTPESLSKFRFHGGNTTSQVAWDVNFLERVQGIFSALHQEQKQFLARVYSEAVAEKLTDLSFNLGVCHDRYLIARFRKKPKVQRKEAHRQLVNHPQFYTYSHAPHQKWFLQWGDYIPDVIFTTVFNQVYGQNRLKRFLRSLLS